MIKHEKVSKNDTNKGNDENVDGIDGLWEYNCFTKTRKKN